MRIFVKVQKGTLGVIVSGSLACRGIDVGCIVLLIWEFRKAYKFYGHRSIEDIVV